MWLDVHMIRMEETTNLLKVKLIAMHLDGKAL